MSKKKAMFNLRIIAGKHYEGSRCYTQGDTLSSAKPLHKLFKNKFALISTEKVNAEEAVVPELTLTAKKKTLVSIYNRKEKGYEVYRIDEDIAEEEPSNDVIREKGSKIHDGYLTKDEKLAVMAMCDDDDDDDDDDDEE